MTEILYSPKIKPEHLARRAIVYLRQSSEKQVRQNKESQRLQYDVAERMRALGWKEVEIVDGDLGCSAAMASARREGFERVLSSVALGEVGIVGSREVSRLSRTDKDWCRLLEVCQIFGTLIADEQQVYDLNYLDDQLVLGIKGTLSVVELKVLRQRLQAGQESKARRGELFKRLPVGYVLDLTGKVVVHPDQRVCEAIQMVFVKFRERWSIRQTFQWFRDHDVELPVNPIQGTRLVWKIPTQSLVRDLLCNPFYAGAYVWGRRPMATVLAKGRLEKRQGAMRRAEDCRVFIPDHHVGYIDWATYEENQRMIRRNSMNWQGDESMAAIRAGQGLLVGLLRCGHCGRKLHVRYWGGRGTNARYLCKGDYDDGGQYCLGFGGASRKIIFLSAGGQRSLCQLSAKFSPINRILSSSSEDSDHRFPLRLDNRCFVASTSANFSFQRRSSSPATRRFLASTASYCSNAFLASYSSCSSLPDKVARWAASPALSSSSAFRLASTPRGEIAFSTSSPNRRSTEAPPKPRQYWPPSS
jgi:DNA invertase Pin-like site-specific DNA recombinase